MRIDNFLSNLKYTTRRDCKKFLKNANITILDTRILDPSYHFDPTNTDVFLNNEKIFYKEHLYLMINKPINYLSAHHDSMHKVVFELLKEPYNRFDFVIAGRLDLDSEGLLILTTDGDFAHHIMSPNTKIKKVYQVILDKPFIDEEKLLKGFYIKERREESYFAKAVDVSSNEKEATITITEGKNRQVRKMFAYIGYNVLNLKRIKIGNLALGDLKLGDYQEFRKEDLND